MSNPKYLLSRLYGRLIFMPRRLIRATSCRKGWICLACEPRRSSVKPPPFKKTVIAGAPPRTLLFTRVSPEPAAGGNSLAITPWSSTIDHRQLGVPTHILRGPTYLLLCFPLLTYCGAIRDQLEVMKYQGSPVSPSTPTEQ